MTDRFSLRVLTNSPDQTHALGGAIGSVVEPGDVVLLRGELGAGKTTLTKGLVAALGGGDVVTSPTFTLCHRYETTPPVAHVDCFRIGDDDDLADLTLDELLDDGYVVIVEWGDRARSALGPDAMVCSLMPTAGEPDARLVEIDLTGTTWADRADVLIQTLRAERLAPELAGGEAR